VSFIHPAGHAHGWEEIKQFYSFFGTAFSDRQLTVRDVSIHVEGNGAWVEFYWHFKAKQRNDGARLKQTAERHKSIRSPGTAGNWFTCTTPARQ